MAVSYINKCKLRHKSSLRIVSEITLEQQFEFCKFNGASHWPIIIQ